jgi:hypothetical protein
MVDTTQNEMLRCVREWLIGEGFVCQGLDCPFSNDPSYKGREADNQHFGVILSCKWVQIYVTGATVDVRVAGSALNTASVYYEFDLSDPECFPQVKAKIEEVDAEFRAFYLGGGHQ